jgi:hypothetical protein
MKIFLAGEGGRPWIKSNYNDFFRLDSYLFAKSKNENYEKYSDFILDSGAYTFLTSKKNEQIDWKKYANEYANFIIEKKIKNYIEIDIDSIIGLKEVEKIRGFLETKIGYQSIPVWHKSRGLDYYINLCKNYNYIAIGGIAIQTIKRNQYPIFTTLLKIAKENNCKVHGLGFTNLKGLEKYKFYSVDSTSWISGNQFGAVYLFNRKSMSKFNKKEGKRVKSKEVAIHNFNEWVKFSKYAENNL